MPQNRPIITLTTDFGTRDPFVGMMKGVILGIAPEVYVVDITHEIPPQDISTGAWVFLSTWRYFPPGTIHVGVVDPEVGGTRRPLVLRARGHLFVGPDNGLFTGPLEADPEAQAWALQNPRYRIQGPVSTTFHGRDLFAPAAAWLALGISPEAFGPPIPDPVRLPLPRARRSGRTLEGEVILVDRFGNLITNLLASDVDRLLKDTRAKPKEILVAIGGRILQGLQTHYAQIPQGQPGALINSTDQVEIYVYCGHAAQALGAGVGDPVRLWIP